MKKLVIILLITAGTAATGSAQNSVVHIRNNAHRDIMYGFTIEHGLQGTLPGLIHDGQVIDLYFNPNVLTGTEGYINLYPPEQPGMRAQIYYDNPLIGSATYALIPSDILQCKPLKWELINSGRDCELTVELVDPASMYGKPVPVTLNNKATITGSIFWNLNDIISPVVNPYGQAFRVRLTAPTHFVESKGPFTLEKTGIYDGKNGFFQGTMQTGSLSWQTVSSFNPGFAEIRYSITGVPTGVPLELDVTTDLSQSNWYPGPQKPRPGDNYYFLVGTFPSSFKSTITIDNNISKLNGADFSCEGDWVKLDENGNISGGGNMVNKIAARRSGRVLPGDGAISIGAMTGVQSNQQLQLPGSQSKTQQVQVQKVRTAGAVKIRQ